MFLTNSVQDLKRFILSEHMLSHLQIIHLMREWQSGISTFLHDNYLWTNNKSDAISVWTLRNEQWK